MARADRLLPWERGAVWSAEERLWWLLWSRVEGLGWQGLVQLWESQGSLAQAWSAPLDALGLLRGFGSRRLAAIDQCRQHFGPQPLQAMQSAGERGLGVLVPGDPALPAAIEALERPPLGLYWRGRGSLWPSLARRRAIAVVGTRRPSLHGLAMAEAIGVALARGGWPVVSGLAEGIDAAVHRGCLKAGGRPVGVLGTHLERVYPRHHLDLQRRVGQQGLLISEQPPGAGVRAGHFAARNRLQVALAQAVVLVECPIRSGACQSAELAWDQQMPLWVVPGDAGKLSAAGSNRFLAKGVAALLEADDLVRQLGPGPLLGPKRTPRSVGVGDGQALASPGGVASPGAGVEGRDDELLAAVGQGASLEQLCRGMALPAKALTPRLLQLELAGLLQAEAGLCWRPA